MGRQGSFAEFRNYHRAEIDHKWEKTLPTNDSNSRFDSNGFWSAPTPTWDDWNRKTKCRLWEAVALACDVDPVIFQPYGLTAEAAQDSVLTPVASNVRYLLDLAKIAVGSGMLKVSPSKDAGLMQREVELADFTAWLRMLGHETPIDFPWTARELVSGTFQWPWGNYQTKSLQFLALAADKFWKNYDPSDHSTAPKNDTVIAWLEKQGVARRKAEVMASLLRADDLPTGPR